MVSTPAASGRFGRVVGLVGTGHFFSHFYMLVLPPLFPLLKVEFGVSYTALGAIVTAFAVSSGLLQIPAGFLVDRVGARFVLIGGLVLVAGGTVLMGLTESYWGLVSLALVAGVGGAVFHPADYTILSASIERTRLGRAFSLHTFSGLIGWAAAPPVMIFLTALWGWHVALVLVGCVGLAVALAIFLQRDHLREETRARRPAAAKAGGNSAALLLSPPILLLFGFFVMIATTSTGLQAFSVTALVQLHGLDLAAASTALTGFLVAGAVGVLAGGVVADRTDRYDLVALVGFLAASTLIALVAALPLSFLLIVVSLSLAGFMQGAIWPSRDMMVRALTPEGASGKVFGFVSSGLDIGAALSPLLFGLLVDQGLPAAVFWCTSFFMMVSLVLALAAARFARRAAFAYAAE